MWIVLPYEGVEISFFLPFTVIKIIIKHVIQEDLPSILNLMLVSKEWNSIARFSSAYVPGNWAVKLTCSKTILEFSSNLMEKFINFRGMGNIKTKSLYFTPLHEAVDQDDIETLEKYLKNGASPDIRTRGFGYTPLYKAAEAGNLEMVKILFQFNANKEIVSKTGKNPYDIAIKKGHHKIAELLDNY